MTRAFPKLKQLLNKNVLLLLLSELTKVLCSIGIQTQSRRVEGTDESTELQCPVTNKIRRCSKMPYQVYDDHQCRFLRNQVSCNCTFCKLHKMLCFVKYICYKIFFLNWKHRIRQEVVHFLLLNSIILATLIEHVKPFHRSN